MGVWVKEGCHLGMRLLTYWNVQAVILIELFDVNYLVKFGIPAFICSALLLYEAKQNLWNKTQFDLAKLCLAK